MVGDGINDGFVLVVVIVGIVFVKNVSVIVV